MMTLFPFLSLWSTAAAEAEKQRVERLEASGEYDFSGVPEGIEAEFLRQAELCLQSTIQVAIASDSRATTLTGTIGAAAAALFVLAGNMASKDASRTDLLAAILVAAGIFALSAIFCNAAARPINFHTAGYQPAVLYYAASSDRHIRLEAVSDIQKRIEANNWSLAKASQALTFGRLLAAGAPIASFIVFCLLYR